VGNEIPARRFRRIRTRWFSDERGATPVTENAPDGVFKALADATTNPWNNYERLTDPKSPAHLEELHDDLDQFAQSHLMAAVRAMQRVGQARSTIVYMVERNLMSPAERQQADDPSPSNPSS
jgi:hypothetical protein